MWFMTIVACRLRFLGWTSVYHPVVTGPDLWLHGLLPRLACIRATIGVCLKIGDSEDISTHIHILISGHWNFHVHFFGASYYRQIHRTCGFSHHRVGRQQRHMESTGSWCDWRWLNDGHGGCNAVLEVCPANWCPAGFLVWRTFDDHLLTFWLLFIVILESSMD